MTARRRILALGGHDFGRRVGNDAICDLIVELADSPRPKACLLPTASGDPEDQIVRFRRAFGERDCVPEAISLFRLGENPVDLRLELLNQDVIYAGGGKSRQPGRHLAGARARARSCASAGRRGS